MAMQVRLAMYAQPAILALAVHFVLPTITSHRQTVLLVPLWGLTAPNAAHQQFALLAPSDILELHVPHVLLDMVETTALHAHWASILQDNYAYHALILVFNVLSAHRLVAALCARSAMMELIANSVILAIPIPTVQPANTVITKLILAVLDVVPVLR